MKFITVRDFRTRPAQIWKELPNEEGMVITNNGKPMALLSPLSDHNLEETIGTIRKVKTINAVKKMHEISVSLGSDKMSLAEINKEIKAYRNKRS